MKTAIKTEFICVKPLTEEAIDRFENKMDRFHSCKVQDRKGGRLYLSSISGRYLFSMVENGDDNWQIIT